VIRKPVVYLAGAIRDGRYEDIDWREQVMQRLDGRAVFLNPLGGKTYNPTTREWRLSGIASTAPRIVKHDFWCVDRADIVLANVTSLAEGYPSIGTLVELGRASARGALVYLVAEPGYRGHENSAMFALHPFLEQIAAAVFDSMDEATDFLEGHLNVLSGADPGFIGVVCL
jgi:nucleoside 2-deoxyribosyltransferase